VARTESLIDGDQLAVSWVQLEAGTRRGSPLKYQIVAICPVHEEAELQAGRPGANDDVLRLDHFGRRRRGLLSELVREPRHQLVLPPPVGAQQGVDGIEFRWLALPKQLDQRVARLGRGLVRVGPSPRLVKQPV
jgi:hypothetical protein